MGGRRGGTRNVSLLASTGCSAPLLYLSDPQGQVRARSVGALHVCELMFPVYTTGNVACYSGTVFMFDLLCVCVCLCVCELLFAATHVLQHATGYYYTQV